jgi:putative DNA primase/helicase
MSPKVVPIMTESPQDAVDAAYRATDTGLARQFVEQWREELRYCKDLGGWLRYADGCWGQKADAAVYQRIAETADAIWSELPAAPPDHRKVLIKFATRADSERGKAAALTLARHMEPFPVAAEVFDQDPFLFNVANGTINLQTGDLQPHRAEDFLTKQSPIVYDATSTCPRFLDFLRLIFNGDESLIDFVQRAGGYSLTGSLKAQCLFFGWGTGCNGKTTLLNVLHAIAGDYGRVAMPTLLMFQQHEPHPTEIADLFGARLVSSVETERDRRLAETKIKWLTGNEKKLKGRFMHRDAFEFTPTHKFWLLGNYKPVVQGQDTAIWRRLHLIPFTVNLKERLGDALVEDFDATLVAEYPGILRWFVEGAVAFHTDGLKPPSIVQQATASYREEMDAVAIWLEEFCERAPGARTPFKVLFDAYQEEMRHDALSRKSFGQELSRLGIDDEKKSGIKIRLGIRLRSQQQDDQDDG